MKILKTTKLKTIGFTLAASILATGAIAATVEAADETYEWSAEVVRFDKSAETLTVRARIESYAPISDLSGYSEGQRLTLVWTGRSWAAGVRDVGVSPDLPEGALSLPIEFVHADDNYVTFRVHVPGGSVAKVAALEPGERVTGHSPRGDTPDWEAGVVSLRHYNDVDW